MQNLTSFIIIMPFLNKFSFEGKTMKKSFLFVFAFVILLNFSACESQKAEKNEINSSTSLNLKQDEMRLKSVDCGADKSAQNAECNEHSNTNANLSANSNENSTLNSNANSNLNLDNNLSLNLNLNSSTNSKLNLNSNTNSQEMPNLELNSSQNSTQKPTIKVFATVPPLTALLEILYPQGMIGLNYKPYPENIEFLPENVANLPVLGVRDRINYEAIVALKPDIIIFDKSVDKALSEPYKRVGIKVLEGDFDFALLENNIRLYGENLGVKERADRLLRFHHKTQSLLDDLRKKVQKKPKIYFALGVESLQSECVKADEIDDLATLIGAENVVKCEQITTSKNILPLNYEQIIALNPEAIFVREIALYKELMSAPNEQWQRVQAIKDKKIYYAPSSPSNWLTRPPTVMRIVGYPWAFSKLHPELLSGDETRAIAKEFFAEFLRPISDEDYERLEGK